MKSKSIWFVGYNNNEIAELAGYLNRDKDINILCFDSYDVLNLDSINDNPPLLVVAVHQINDFLLFDKIKLLPKRFLGCIVVLLKTDEESEVIQLMNSHVCDVISSKAPKNYLAAKLKVYLERITNKNLQEKIWQISNEVKNEFTRKEIEILMYITNKNHLGTSRSELTEAIWDGGTYSKVLDVHLFNLRKKLVSHKLKIFSKDKAWYISEEY